MNLKNLQGIFESITLKENLNKLKLVALLVVSVILIVNVVYKVIKNDQLSRTDGSISVYNISKYETSECLLKKTEEKTIHFIFTGDLNLQTLLRDVKTALAGKSEKYNDVRFNFEVRVLHSNKSSDTNTSQFFSETSTEKNSDDIIFLQVAKSTPDLLKPVQVLLDSNVTKILWVSESANHRYRISFVDLGSVENCVQILLHDFNKSSDNIFEAIHNLRCYDEILKSSQKADCGVDQPLNLNEQLAISCFFSLLFMFLLLFMFNGKIKKVALPFTKLGIILSYIYICDRTHIFETREKSYRPVNFWVPVSLVALVGIFFNAELPDNPAVMNRCQTEEWKGWMQIFILIYHLTGASRDLFIYMLARVLVSSYLFLNGYVHLRYFWKTTHSSWDSFKRILTVLFRMNFFGGLLCLVMGKRYQFYYFLPLISYWFVIQYCLWILKPSRELKWNFVKVLLLIVTSSFLFYNKPIFDLIFGIPAWKFFFISENSNLEEWWFRWKIDRYSSSFSATFTLAIIKFEAKSKTQHIPNLFAENTIKCGAVALIVAYPFLSLLCSTKESCNDVHAYISFVPIISYLLIRNYESSLRRRYSTFFAFFGKFSLELFLCQYHVWLANDTKGVLVLIPWNNFLNLSMTTSIFILVAHEAHDVINDFTQFICS